MVVGKLDGEEIKYKDKGVLRKIYIKNNKINGFVLLGDISNAGLLFSLIKKRKNIKYYKDYLLDKNFNQAFIMTRYI
jgi:NAD(P)H-nitrite reductase large subunit